MIRENPHFLAAFDPCPESAGVPEQIPGVARI